MAHMPCAVIFFQERLRNGCRTCPLHYNVPAAVPPKNPKPFLVQHSKAIPFCPQTSRAYYSSCTVPFAGAVGLAVLALWDAGYSGDWSRIEVLSNDQEAFVRQSFNVLGLFHLACTAVAVKVVSDKGLNRFAFPAKARPILLTCLLLWICRQQN